MTPQLNMLDLYTTVTIRDAASAVCRSCELAARDDPFVSRAHFTHGGLVHTPLDSNGEPALLVTTIAARHRRSTTYCRR